jgi:hypothetical protein
MKNLWFKISVSLAAIATIAVVVCLVTIDFEDNNATIEGRFVGLNAKMVYLEEATITGGKVIDSVKLDQDGYYQLVVKNIPETPTL